MVIRFETAGIMDGYESLDAVPVGSDRYRIQEIPMAIEGLAVGDIVRCTGEEDGLLESTAEEVVSRGGHSTVWAHLTPVYQSRFLSDESQRKQFIRQIERSGCTMAGYDARIGIDVPINARIQDLVSFLDGMKYLGVLSAHRFSHVFRPAARALH